MSNLKVLCKKIIEHVDNGDLMTALDFFENTMLPYYESMDASTDQALYDLVTKLNETVENEDWNESLEIIDQMNETING